MISSGKYQFGSRAGEEQQNSDFFSSIVNQYQQQSQSEEVEDPYDSEREYDPSEDEDNAYSDLMDRYNALQQEHEETLSRQADITSLQSPDTDDGFMNFLFSKKNNRPIDFDSLDTRAFHSPQAQVNEPVGDKEAIAFNFFKSKGYADHVAAGIVSNIKHESNFKTSAVGDNGKARSLAQWHPDRYSALQKQGYDLNSFQGSLEAIDHELRTSERGAYNNLIKASTAEEAAAIFDKKYERSAGLTTKQRMESAGNIHRKLSKYQIGGEVYKTQKEVDNANQLAKSIARRKYTGTSVINPEDVYVAKNVGDTVVPFIDSVTGRPDTPTPQRKKAYNVPYYIELSDIVGDGDNYAYEDRDGHWVDVDSSVINLQRFRNQAQIPVATTPNEQKVGLNNSNYDEMFFPTQGENIFRGLDNGQPVALLDEKGKKKILNNKYDTVKMSGNVKEKRIR